MKPQRMTLGHPRMLELFVSVAHVDALRDGARPCVANNREREDLCQGDALESRTKRFAGSLAGKALPQKLGANRQPTSTQGAHGRTRRGAERPTKPIN